MKNLKLDESIDTFGVHTKIVDKMHTTKSGHKLKLQDLAHKIKIRFDKYQTIMKNNVFEKMTPRNYSEEEKEALKKTYKYSNEDFQKYCDDVLENGNRCPYCDLEIVSSIDHYLPQVIFPEYSDLLINFIPSCSKCNSKKGDAFLKTKKDNGKDVIITPKRRAILNLYKDQIPCDQFLKCEINISNMLPVVSYYFENKYVNTLIEDSYKILELKKRYEDEITKTILKDLIKEIQQTVTFVSGSYKIVIDILTREYNKYYETHGKNHYLTSFYNEALNNGKFIYYLMNSFKKR